MRFHHRRAFRIIRALPAFLLALLLCACSISSRTPNVPGASPSLPVIGVPDLDPDAVPTTAPESTEASGEITDTEPESTEAAGSTESPEAAESSEAEESAESTETAETTEAAVPTEEESTEEATEATEEEETTAEPTKTAGAGWRVWIGDSRFSGIHDNVKYDTSKDHFISGWGVAYYWFIDTAIPALDTFAAKHQVDAVYWCLCANDISQAITDQNYQSAGKYATELNKLIAKYPDTTFYVLSYGPVGGDGKKPSDVKNVDLYNQVTSSYTDYVYTHTSAQYINLAAYLESSGYTTTDGRNYDAATNKKIYDYVLSQSGY